MLGVTSVTTKNLKTGETKDPGVEVDELKNDIGESQSAS